MKRVVEPERETEVGGRYDVIVCGAGPAGVAAAIAAARKGARTLLIELHGTLGGVWTSGLLACVLDADNKEGLLSEIVARLKARSGHTPRPRGKNFLYDPEQMKLALEELCVEAGVEVLLHTRVVGVHREGRRLKAVLTESKSGREAFSGRVFIDTTGDGDLAALAGCGYSFGHETTGEFQPMSLMALLWGVDPEASLAFHDLSSRTRKDVLLAEMRRAGFEPSYALPTLFHIHDQLYALMTNHEYGVSPFDARAITRATIQARREVDDAVRALRSLGGIWKDLRMVATAAQMGVREGRRIHGIEQVTAEDLIQGRLRDDGVCRATFEMDVHSTNPARGKGIQQEGMSKVMPYDIPYGALVAADVDGLMMAGRCISGDFLAHSSYRVTGNAVPMGEAAGTAAALCVAMGIAPHELDWAKHRSN